MRPWWVQAFIGPRTDRRRAWAICFIAWTTAVAAIVIPLVLTIACYQNRPEYRIEFGQLTRLIPFTLLFVVIGLWAYLAMRWVDRHGDWRPPVK